MDRVKDESVLEGACLCDGISFHVFGALSNIYQCHCSECRKVTGSSANSSCLIHENQFQWIAGADMIRCYSSPSGYTSHFCGICGSPVPNVIGDTGLYWVPAGLLKNTSMLEVVAHLCVTSKADWDVSIVTGSKYEHVPNFDELLKVLARKG